MSCPFAVPGCNGPGRVGLVLREDEVRQDTALDLDALAASNAGQPCKHCSTCMLCGANPLHYLIGDKSPGFGYLRRPVDSRGAAQPIHVYAGIGPWGPRTGRYTKGGPHVRRSWATVRVPVEECWNWYYAMDKEGRFEGNRPLPAGWLLENVTLWHPESQDPGHRVLCPYCAAEIRRHAPPPLPRISLARIEPADFCWRGERVRLTVQIEGDPFLEHMARQSTSDYPAASARVRGTGFDVDETALFAFDRSGRARKSAVLNLTLPSPAEGAFELDALRNAEPGATVRLPYTVRDYPSIGFADAWAPESGRRPVFDMADWKSRDLTLTIALDGPNPEAIRGTITSEALAADKPFTIAAGPNRGAREIRIPVGKLKAPKDPPYSETCDVWIALDPNQKCLAGDMHRTLTLIETRPGTAPCPASDPEKDPCNLKSLTIRVTHGGKPAKRGLGGRTDGVFKVVAPGHPEAGGGALVCRPGRPALIQVIAGDAVPAAEAEKAFHQTSLEVALEMDDHCARHPLVAVFERTRSKDGVSAETPLREQAKIADDAIGADKTAWQGADVLRATQPWDESRPRSLLALFRDIYFGDYFGGDFPTDRTAIVVKEYRVEVLSCGKVDPGGGAVPEADRLEALIQVFPSDEYALSLTCPALQTVTLAEAAADEAHAADDPPSGASGVDRAFHDTVDALPKVDPAAPEEETFFDIAFAGDRGGRAQSWSFYRGGDDGEDFFEKVRNAVVAWAVEEFTSGDDQPDQVITPLPAPRPGQSSGVMLGRNNAAISDSAQKVLDSVNRVIKAAWALQEVWTGIQNLIPSLGWGMDFGLGVMQGKLDWRWGFKEFDDWRVFYWQEVDIEIVLLSLYFRIHFGLKAGVWIVKFEFVLYGLMSLHFPYTNWFQVQGPDAAESMGPGEAKAHYRKLNADPPSAVQTDTSFDPQTALASTVRPGRMVSPEQGGWFGTHSHNEFGVNLVLIHESIFHANAHAETGYRIRARPVPGHPGIEQEKYYLGVSLVGIFTLKFVCNVRKTISVVDGDPPGAPRAYTVFPREQEANWHSVRRIMLRAGRDVMRKQQRLAGALNAWREARLHLILTTRGLTVREDAVREDGFDIAPHWARVKRSFAEENARHSRHRGFSRRVGDKLREHADKGDEVRPQAVEALEGLKGKAQDLQRFSEKLTREEYNATTAGQVESSDRHKAKLDALLQEIKDLRKAAGKKTGARKLSNRLRSSTEDLLYWAEHRVDTVKGGS